jgi:hypothetical protein
VRRRAPAVRLLVALVLWSTTATAESSARPEVELLRFPHPYRAALTVCSDTHSASPERFEAVHKLVNTEEWIAKGSSEWNRLFDDPAIERDPRWAAGVRGFGLRMGDSIWLYDPRIGVFERFDEVSGRAVPHRHEDGRDHREIVDSWFRRGWVDVLHTAGEGDLPREAVRQGLAWLSEAPHRRVSVWVNHGMPTLNAIEPDVWPAFALVVPNLGRLVTWGLVRTPAKDFVRARVLFPAPRAFPPDQRGLLWSLSIALVLGAASLGTCLVVRRLRRKALVLGSLVLLGATLSALRWIPLRHAQGDNPGSRYYNADLVKGAGIRFFSLIRAPDAIYDQQVDLPEIEWNGRRTFLRQVRLDDGTQTLMFPRVHFGWEGDQSLELTEERLDRLVAQRRASILYTHWLNVPVFTAEALEGLANLRRRYDAGEIWVAPTSELVRFEFVRTFLRYDVRREGETLVLDLGLLEDPIDGARRPRPEELAGISFAIRGHPPVQPRLGGEPLPDGDFDVIATGDETVVRIQPSGG